MSSQRKAIRNAVLALLKGNTSVNENVFANRFLPLSEDQLPAILIYTLSDATRELNQSPRTYRNIVSLIIDIRAQVGIKLDDELDDISQEVLDIILANETLSGTCERCLLQEGGSMDIVTENGNKETGVLRITWGAEYTLEAPEIQAGDLDNFDTANIKMEIPPTDGTPEFVGSVTDIYDS